MPVRVAGDWPGAATENAYEVHSPGGDAKAEAGGLGKRELGAARRAEPAGPGGGMRAHTQGHRSCRAGIW